MLLFLLEKSKISAASCICSGRYLAYRSLKRGQTLLRDIGFEDHVALVASLLEETPPARARNGDIALVNGHALGILSAERVFVLHPDGLGSVTRLQAERAFRV
jgi:hypothetical protein